MSCTICESLLDSGCQVRCCYTSGVNWQLATLDGSYRDFIAFPGEKIVCCEKTLCPASQTDAESRSRNTHSLSIARHPGGNPASETR